MVGDQLQGLLRFVPHEPGKAGFVMLSMGVTWWVVDDWYGPFGSFKQAVLALCSLALGLLFVAAFSALSRWIRVRIRTKKIARSPRKRLRSWLRGLSSAEKHVLRKFLADSRELMDKDELWDYLGDVCENSQHEPPEFEAAIESLISHGWIWRGQNWLRIDRNRFEHLCAMPEELGSRAAPRGPLSTEPKKCFLKRTNSA